MSSKLREAVSRLVREIEDGMLIEVSSKFECDLAKTLLANVKSALAEPLRNCDIYTMEEQSKRYEEYCKSHSINGRCVKCPLWQMRLLGINCAIAWANLPSDALEDNKKVANEKS